MNKISSLNKQLMNKECMMKHSLKIYNLDINHSICKLLATLKAECKLRIILHSRGIKSVKE